MVIVIPAYCEPDLLRSLSSLLNCDPPPCAVEVIIVFNDSEKDTEETSASNKKAYEEAVNWAKINNLVQLRFFPLYHPQLAHKTAGVGLARKIGMDEAAFRLEQAGNSNGIILCFDADSLCEENYLQEVDNFFRTQPKLQACSIYFEHPLEGDEYGKDVYQAIIEYELHLRYYIHAQRWAGFPFAYQTIGSSMAVRSDAYQQQGGMNRRKAGEDFYFLHKFTSLGHFGELKSTTVIPSPRISGRVPFGTGKAVGEIIAQKGSYLSYAPQVFEDLKFFLEQVEGLNKTEEVDKVLSRVPKSVREFLTQINFSEKLAEIKHHTASQEQFTKRFFRWFNAFQLMKYVHFARDHYYPNVSVGKAASWLLEKVYEKKGIEKEMDLLKYLRTLDKNKPTFT